MLKSGTIPSVCKTKYAVTVGHNIHNLTIIFPTAYHTRFNIVDKLSVTEHLLEIPKAAICSKFNDTIDIHSRTNVGGSRIIGIQFRYCSSDKHDIIT